MPELLTKETAAVLLTRLRVWLKNDGAIVKQGMLAKRAGLDDGAMSNIVHGERNPRPQTTARLIAEAEKYGFDRTKE